jgi:glutamate---cysteine ligase / carboxylate-amine ligase
MATRRSTNQPTTAAAEPRPRSGTGSTGSFKSSVLDHRFGKGSPLTVGVEEEYMLLDATTFDLQNSIEQVLDAVQGSPIEGQVHPELMEGTVEVASKVCKDIDDARRELTKLRRGLAEAIASKGLRIGGAGTHPFALAEDQRITSRDRYRYIVEQLQYVARRELVFGMHVHVGVPSPETCMSVMEGVLVELPVLLALSSNSPFWRGKPSGLASTRQAVFAGFPRSGLPPRFGSYEDYAETVAWMETTNVIGDYTHLWWDVRPHPRLGTIELRVPDVQFDVEYSLALTAYVQALVMEILDECEKGSPPVSYHRALVAENKWLAARYGVDAQMMDLAGGRRVRLPASQLARRRLRQLAPFAKELGCNEALQGIERILETGTGAARQLRVYNANQDLVEVMGELASVTELASLN